MLYGFGICRIVTVFLLYRLYVAYIMENVMHAHPKYSCMCWEKIKKIATEFFFSIDSYLDSFTSF